jgi:hypothetical protein
MATLTDVRRIARSLPETTEGEGEHASWQVKGKTFAWERPLRRGDLEALGDTAPKGIVLAVRVADLDTKDALLTEYADVLFTTPHFNGYPAVLVRLSRIKVGELRDLLTDAWLARAPKLVARAFAANGK